MRVLVSLDGNLDDALCRASAYLCEAGRDSAALLSVIHPDAARETHSGLGSGITPLGTSTGVLLNVPTPSTPMAEGRDQAVQRVSDTRLAQLRSLAERYFSHVPVEVRVDISGDPAAAILDAAAEVKADGIAVGARKQSGLAAVVLGSVSGDLLKRSPVPVLVIREDMRTAVA
ncbi:MAG: universal stress protein [Dehalococcoidia bacterium]|nr:universal stress protein [Dehalococcoidia bacterium]